MKKQKRRCIMLASIEHDRVLLEVEDRSTEVSEDGTSEYPDAPLSMARGMVNGVWIGLIFWAIIIYLLMK
jgi:hypothetical protein